MEEELAQIELKKKNRTFSKRMVFLTFILAWAAVYMGIYFKAETVAVAAISLIGAVASVYMGVGHLDYRAILTSKK